MNTCLDTLKHSAHKLSNPLILAVLLASLLLNACAQPAAPTSAPQPRQNVQTVEVMAEGEAIVAAPAAGMPQATLAAPNDAAYIDNFFKNYGVNPFIDTDDDHLSTFAMDVDTGAYTVARRYVQDGNLPPADAVRVEEFVNYFQQGYPIPSREEVFGIHVDGAPSPFSQTERYEMLRIGIQGYTVSAEERKDAALTFVIDVSGSMDMENRLELVKEALTLLVNQLRPSDTVSLVVYGSTAHVVLKPTPGDQRETILNGIYRLRPEGSTNAEAGLDLGYDMALKSFKPGAINRVILCSDGVANVGNTGAGSIWDTIKTRASEGILLTTVGFGMGNYNDVLMEQLADNGNGSYAYVDNLQEAQRIFVGSLSGTLQTIALDAKVQVDFNPEVVARYRLVGYENRAVADNQFRDDSVDAGEIGAGHSVTALYEVKLQPQASGKIATVYMRWEDPDNHNVTEIEQAIHTENMAATFEEAAPRFQWAVIVAEYAEILRESYWAEGSNLMDVVTHAMRVSVLLENEEDSYEFVQLVQRALEIKNAQ